MGSYQDPGFRPSGWDIAGDHEGRIGILEAVPPTTNTDLDPGSYAALVLSYVGSSLLGYWRLGETTGDFADSSGQSPPYPLSVISRGTDPTRGVTGCLPAAYDDGAVEIHPTGDYLNAASVGRFDFASGGVDFTVAGWLNVNANASSIRGEVVGNYSSTPPAGWLVGVSWPTREITFTRIDTGNVVRGTVSGGSLAASECVHFAASYKGSVSPYRMAIYLNGTLINTATTAGGGTPTWNQGLTVGGTVIAAGDWYFDGMIDELAIWNAALTAAEILALSERGLPSAVVAEGKVLTADGAGGTTWEFPIEVSY